MTLEEIIKSAIEYEIRVRDIYVKSLDRIEEESGKKTIKLLAEEEQHHVDYLQSRLEEWQKTGALSKEKLKTALPSKKEITVQLRAVRKNVRKKDYKTEITFLKKALKMERETTDFFKRTVKELSGEEQELFQRFIEIEEGHEALVQAEIDSLTGMGYWFDIGEFRLEAQ